MFEKEATRSLRDVFRDKVEIIIRDRRQIMPIIGSCVITAIRSSATFAADNYLWESNRIARADAKNAETIYKDLLRESL